MNLLTLEEILSNFPVILIVWTALTLCWGIYINVAFFKMLSRPCAHNGITLSVDAANVKFVLGGNSLLALYLLLQPYVTQYVGDAIVVINVFFSFYLLAASIKVGSWWKHTCESHTP